ncbi:sex peptide receptor-related protein 2-like [Planococcus citri]|uniref:sex peptide receptor-related protein 2-like n=1 Tax=Planococcus citri TaxID=170843 RepID=UPI0031F7ED6D
MGQNGFFFWTLDLQIPPKVAMNHTEPHCGTAWKTFQDDFRQTAFSPIMITLYVLGVIFNSLSITVFTTKHKITSSNVLFTSLAISDLTVSILGIPFWWLFLRPTSGASSGSGHSIVGHYYLIILRLFFNVSVLHTTNLAIWRFIAVTYPLKERKWCNLKNTFISIGLHYTFCILYEVKTLFCYTNVADIALLKNNTEGSNSTTNVNGTIHTMRNITSERASTTQIGTNGFLCTLPEYIYVVVVRILPCIVIIICSFRLIYVLQHSKKRRNKLMPNMPQNDVAKDAEKEKQMNRTTRMLLGIMILFLLDKVPSAIVKFLIILYDINFIHDCLPAIAQVISILSLIYVSTPFLAYYVSSQHFRNSFKSLFPAKKCMKSSDTDASTQMNTDSTHF